MATMKEFENGDNPKGVMPEYRAKLTQMWQYANRTVKNFLFDAGTETSKKVYADNAAAIAGGLKPGDWYVTESGTDYIVKIVK